MDRPDDAVIRIHVTTFAVVRRLLPIAILVGSFAGPMYVAEPRVAMWASAALFCASLFGLWTLEGLPLYPAHRFGIEYRFEDDPLDGYADASGSATRHCVHCERVVDDGVHRRYARQFVLLGVPIYTFAWGENDICRDCLEAAAYGAGSTGRARRRGTGRRRRGRSSENARVGHAPSDAAGRASSDAAGSPSGSRPESGSTPPDGATSDAATQTDEHTALVRRRSESGPDPDSEPEPETAIVRRVDLTDDTAALEVERAFEDEPA